MSSKPELLAPAGNLEKLRLAVHYGADAVYLGTAGFCLRAHATFNRDTLATAVHYAHEHGVKAYITINILAHNRDFAGLPDYLRLLRDLEVDGLIIADPGVLAVARETVPEIPVHLSTQANVTNTAAARFWQAQGVRRLNLARELSLAEIGAIRRATQLSLEIFVHGALCISYSGRCLLSLAMTGRNANQGDCAQPCRYRYALVEEKRPGQYFSIAEDSHGSYIMNSRDLCLLHQLPQLMAAGADSLKIEGRMKSPYYVGGVVRIYRAAIDFIARQQEAGTPLAAITLPPAFGEEIDKIGSRGYSENFIQHPPTEADMLHQKARERPSHEPVGIIREAMDPPLIETRNPLLPGETIEYLGFGLSGQEVTITAIHDQNGSPLPKANPGNLVTLKTRPEPQNWQALGLLRRQCDDRS